MQTKPTLVLGGTGKTGRRIVDRLTARGVPVRVGSRSAPIPFDVPVSVEEYAAGAAEHGGPEEFVGFLTYLFSDVLGRNAYLTDGVRRALGRDPRDFGD
jgi:uncharacterized protein YbjT (DUF2867 family)